MLSETRPISRPFLDTTRNCLDPPGPYLIQRTSTFEAWRQQFASSGFLPYSRAFHAAPGDETTITHATCHLAQGASFASQDHFSLATSSALKLAAIEAFKRFGAQSVGSSALLGNTSESLALEAELGLFVQTPDVTLYRTSCPTGYGITTGLDRPSECVVLDALAHSCAMEVANAATPHVSLFRHLDLVHLREQPGGDPRPW